MQMGRRSVDFVRYHVNLARDTKTENSNSKDTYKIYSRDRSQQRQGSKNQQSLNGRYFFADP